MTEKLDLDALDRLLAAATPAPWIGDRYDGTVKYDVLGPGAVKVISSNTEDTDYELNVREADIALVLALRNSAPALLAELRALRRVAAAAKATLKWAREFCEERGCEGDTPDGSCPDYKEVIDDWCDPCRVWRAVEASDEALKEAGL